MRSAGPALLLVVHHTITVNLSCRMMMILPAIASSLFLDQEQQAAKGTRKRPTNNNSQGCCMNWLLLCCARSGWYCWLGSSTGTRCMITPPLLHLYLSQSEPSSAWAWGGKDQHAQHQPTITHKHNIHNLRGRRLPCRIRMICWYNQNSLLSP